MVSATTMRRWLRPEAYPLFATLGLAVGICGFSMVRNMLINPEVRVNKENRAAGAWMVGGNQRWLDASTAQEARPLTFLFLGHLAVLFFHLLLYLIGNHNEGNRENPRSQIAEQSALLVQNLPSTYRRRRRQYLRWEELMGSLTATTYESVAGGENKTKTDLRSKEDAGMMQID